jgi:hypothetical protein
MRLGNLTLTTSDPAGALFVAKWNPRLARFMWTQQADESSQAMVTAIAVQGPNVYVLASLWGDTIRLGHTVLATTGSVVKGSYFVAKLLDEGTQAHFSWARPVAESATDEARVEALAVQGADVFVAGNFRDSTTVFGSKMLHASKDGDLFVAKLTDEGSTARLQWVQQGGPAATKYVGALAVRGKAIYVAGTLPKATSWFGANVVLKAGQRNAYVAKLLDQKTTASWVWAQRIGSADNNHVDAIVVQGTRLYVAGNYYRYGQDKPVTPDSTQLGGDGSGDIFITKVADTGPAGKLVWATRAGGARMEYASAIAVQGKSLYVAGRTNSDTLRLGHAALVNTDTTHYFSNALVIKLTDEGKRGVAEWMQQAGGQSQDAAAGLAVSSKQVYVGGVFCSERIGHSDALHTSGFLATLASKSVDTRARRSASQVDPKQRRRLKR